MRKGLNIVEPPFTPQDDSFILDYLEYKGVENFVDFIEKKCDKFTDFENFYMAQEGRNLLRKHIKKNGRILTIVDADADGFTSSAKLVHDLAQLGIKVEPLHHIQKSHGLTDLLLDDIKSMHKEDPVDLLIIPDAGSNDFDNCLELKELGIDILVIDHHMVDDEARLIKITDKNYVILNNQLSMNKEVNRNFVGVGMVYIFLKWALKDLLEAPDKYLELLSIGQVGDASDISNREIRHLVYQGLENIENPFIKQIVDDPNPTSNHLSYSIIPLINSVTRVGKIEEKEMLFNVLTGLPSDEKTIEVERKRKNKETGKMDKVTLKWSEYDLAADLLKKVRTRQNKIVDKVVLSLEENMIDTGSIIIGLTTPEDIEYRSITGLVANKFLTKYSKPTLILVKNEDGTYSGSGRSDESIMKEFRTWCNETDVVELAQGHESAFGFIIQEDMIDQFVEKSNDLKDVDSSQYLPDILYKRNLNNSQIIELNQNEDLFGGNISKPLIAGIGLTVHRNCISQRGSVLKFFIDGIECIKYKTPIGLADELKMGFIQEFTIDIIGEATINNWGGRITHQIVLQDFVFNSDPIKEEIKAEDLVF